MENKELQYKGDGYKSQICEHHQDILVCPECDIFKDGMSVTVEGGWRTKLLHPLMYWSFKREAKRILRAAPTTTEKEEG